MAVQSQSQIQNRELDPVLEFSKAIWSGPRGDSNGD